MVSPADEKPSSAMTQSIEQHLIYTDDAKLPEQGGSQGGCRLQPAVQRGKTSKVTRFHTLRDYCPWSMTSRDFHDLLGQGSLFRSVPFFLINGWAGDKRVVSCAHPYHPGSGTPHRWVSHILRCARTGAKGQAVLTVMRRTCAG